MYKVLLFLVGFVSIDAVIMLTLAFLAVRFHKRSG